MQPKEKKPYQLSDYLNAINNTKERLMDSDDPAWKKKYPAFIVNKCMSYHVDTLLEANIMNGLHHLPNDMQFNFYINILRKRKRFSPWVRKEKVSDLEFVKSYYGYNNEKASQALKILSKEQLDYIKQKLDTGGKR